jgi:hypothetical protein
MRVFRSIWRGHNHIKSGGIDWKTGTRVSVCHVEAGMPSDIALHRRQLPHLVNPEGPGPVMEGQSHNNVIW